MISGENNVYYNIGKYNCTFSKMIESWRNIWYTRTDSITDPVFPFGFVQVRIFPFFSCLAQSLSSLLAINQ